MKKRSVHANPQESDGVTRRGEGALTMETLREKLLKLSFFECEDDDAKFWRDRALDSVVQVVREHAAQVARLTDFGTRRDAALHAQYCIATELEKM